MIAPVVDKATRTQKNSQLGPNSNNQVTQAGSALVNGHGDTDISHDNLNGSAHGTSSSGQSSSTSSGEAAWGSQFWVTIVDPQSQTQFYACPATGQVSWDPPVGNFVLPPSDAGEWWELSDDSRGGIPYYYHTKTGETQWERPEDFVIPLSAIQNTTLGRRLSSRFSQAFDNLDLSADELGFRHSYRPSRAGANHRPSPISEESDGQKQNGSEPRIQVSRSGARSSMSRPAMIEPKLTPIPGSEASDQQSSASSLRSVSPPASPTSPSPLYSTSAKEEREAVVKTDEKLAVPQAVSLRTRSSSSALYNRQPQNLDAAAQKIATSASDSGHGTVPRSPTIRSSVSSDGRLTSSAAHTNATNLGTTPRNQNNRSPIPPRSPRLPNAPTVGGKVISSPMPNHAATIEMGPVKNRATGGPILVQPKVAPLADSRLPPSANSGKYPILPVELASDIQQFSETEFAKQYFSNHRTGFIFKRRTPVDQVMTWQKAPIGTPLLTLNKSLNKNALKAFKIIQLLMGDRERERSGNRPPIEAAGATNFVSAMAALEEEKWLLAEGLSHGELRDEIFCQLMKQLTGNPNPESVFKGWQILCVLLVTFPPSKNFETYLSSFIQQHTNRSEGRVDIMAKYSLRKLGYISKKGPRGKPPNVTEIEAAADAAFHPSTFGESLDAIIRLQARKYPEQKVPIILPFLANGILALGGTKAEGIFRVPGDGDAVSDLKLRIDRGYYTTDGVNDPYVLASLMKLWLRELYDPLIPEEMYNECLTRAKDPDACVGIIQRLPTINRRVILFVVSFLQLFLEDRIQRITKMTPANLALVMAPNLLRCNSDSMSVVFTNAQYEQIFVYHLLLHLRCEVVDPHYVPLHGLSAADASANSTPRARSRR